MTNNRSSTSFVTTPVLMMPVSSPQLPQQQQAMMMVPVMPMPAPFAQPTGTTQPNPSSAGVGLVQGGNLTHQQPSHMCPTPAGPIIPQPMMMVPVQPVPSSLGGAVNLGMVPIVPPQQQLPAYPTGPSISSGSGHSITSHRPNSSSATTQEGSSNTTTTGPSALNNNPRPILSSNGPAHFKALRESAAKIDVSDQQEDNGPKQLIINFISLDTTEQDLTTLFSPIGTLDAVRVIVDRNNKNRSKGYAFVYFVSSEDAVKAIKKLQGASLNGKHIKVGFAIPQRPSPAQLARQAMILSEDHIHQKQQQQDQHSSNISRLLPLSPSGGTTTPSAIPHAMSMPLPHPALLGGGSGGSYQPQAAAAASLPAGTAMMMVHVPAQPATLMPQAPRATTNTSGSGSSTGSEN